MWEVSSHSFKTHKNLACFERASSLENTIIRKNVYIDADKTMTVWNNFKDNADVITKDGETTPEATAAITFLASDIVKDNTVNVYDLSILLSYAFTDIDVNAVEDYKYAQYDLNRDGIINYKDAAMILDTYVWGK